MRDLPASLAAHLASGATTLCHCWRIDRADGVSLGFTDHDRDLTFDGVVFRAASALASSTREAVTGAAPTTVEILGALSDDGLVEADLISGAYENARLRLWRVNWADPASRVQLFAGHLATITRQGAAFTAEVLGQMQALNHAHGRLFQSGCDAQLGDARCGVDLTLPAHHATVTVTGRDGDRLLMISGASAFAAGDFRGGQARVVGGALAGTRFRLRDDRFMMGERQLLAWRPLPEALSTGTTLHLTVGCDHRFSTCRQRFGNAARFCGFPHMPGEDWATTYPAQGESHDGASLFA